MSVAQQLGASQIADVVRTFRDLLVSHREMINALNVYPVPDGDTGTNMSLTLESVCTALDDATTLDEVCQAISHGSLMGARGNSGVIMSQILRGLAGTLAECGPGVDEADLLARAFTTAAEAAYGAVQRPVEGTILTVIREIGEEATDAVADGAGVADLIERARVRGHDALERTPEMLPVLKDAGVVDAGGRGLLLIIDSLLHHLVGRELPEPPTEYVRASTVTAPAADDHGGDGDKSIADLRYEVMFLLDAPDDRIGDFRSAWADIGDSIVVVGGDGLFNCHIHTDHIGPAIEAGIAVGRPHQIRITDLLEELDHMETLIDPEAVEAIVVTSTEQTRCGAVAVGVGEGIKRIFAALGAKAVVAGGQSMNPSTELLLEAVERVAADEVLLLPNNKNIIAVAQQVDAHTDKTVRVVPTRSITEGFACLLEFDPGGAADDNATAMTEAAAAVIAGEVTVAVRDAASDAGPVTTGDHIGIGPDGIQAVSDSLVGATTALLDAIVGDDHELVTIIAGTDADQATTDAVQGWLGEHRPDVEVEVHQGGQPLYHYFLGVE